MKLKKREVEDNVMYLDELINEIGESDGTKDKDVFSSVFYMFVVKKKDDEYSDLYNVRMVNTDDGKKVYTLSDFSSNTIFISRQSFDSLINLIEYCISENMEVHIFEEYNKYIIDLFYISKKIAFNRSNINSDIVWWDVEYETNAKNRIGFY